MNAVHLRCTLLYAARALRIGFVYVIGSLHDKNPMVLLWGKVGTPAIPLDLPILNSILPERSEDKSDVSMLNFPIDTTIEWSNTILS